MSPSELRKSQMLKRVHALQTTCKETDLKAYKFEFYQVTSRFYVDTNANLSYCKVPKAGSSFMTEVFFALDKDRNNQNGTSISKSKSVDDIFEMSRRIVHAIGNNKLQTTPLLRDDDTKTTALLVSRDPYSRLYSAFIDKFYLFGLVKASVEISKSKKKRISNCGYDVTFQEFLDYVMKNAYGGYPINRHWAPVYLLCHACDVRYDVVSKMDTLSSDMENILDNINVSYSMRQSLINVIQSKYDNKSAISLIQTYMKFWKQYEKLCPKLIDYLLKIWKSFKIQGKLKSDVPFPKRRFSNAIKKGTNSDGVIDLFLEYMTKYKLSARERRLQRRSYLVKAYAEVSDTTIGKIQELYELDFRLFQYDTSPPTTI